MIRNVSVWVDEFRSLLVNRIVLWTIFWINLAGTVYGFYWYWNQILYTVKWYPSIYVIFVPDSPTASLFFTLSVLFMLYPPSDQTHWRILPRWIRSGIEAFALVTSFKYGIWAVVMIVAGAGLGDSVGWQDGMLVISHLGMAIEALVFAAWYSFRYKALLVVGIWTLWNDVMDYGIGIYPWLPSELLSYLSIISIGTVGLSLISIAIGAYLVNKRTS